MNFKCTLGCLILLVISSENQADSYINPYIYLERIKIVLDAFQADCGHYPNQQVGLTALLQFDDPCWQGPYIRQRSLKGYRGRPIKYAVHIEQGQPRVQLSTYGEDRWWGTADDIRLSDDIGTRRLKFGKVIDKLVFRKQVAMLLTVLGFYIAVNILIYCLVRLCQFLFRLIKSLVATSPTSPRKSCD